MYALNKMAESLDFGKVLKGRKILDELITVDKMPAHIVSIVKDQLWTMWKSDYWTVSAELALQNKLVSYIADSIEQQEAQPA